MSALGKSAIGLFLIGAWSGLAAAEVPVRGGTLNFAVVSEPPNYDCHASATFGLTHTIAPHYSTLLKFGDANYNVVGDLAQSWTASADGLQYTFKLHPNIKFHDGSPLTSADIKASYERVIRPPQGQVSIRAGHYSEFGDIETPDAATVVFKLKKPIAGVLPLLASPWNCIYSAAKLAKNNKYPETEVMGTGPYQFVEHVRGSSWTAKRFEQYFKPGLPYIDGYKAYFVKSPAVIPGLLGGQFDAEFRFFSPSERDRLVAEMGEKVRVHEQPLVAGLMIVINSRRKPFDDPKVRQALSLAIDRWGASAELGKISAIKYVGGVMRPGSEMALPQSELGKLPGFGKDIAAARKQAMVLLSEAGVKNLSFKLLNRSGTDPYTTAAVFLLDQWRRIGVTAVHEQYEASQQQTALLNWEFDVAIDFISDYMDDPTLQFGKLVSRNASSLGYASADDHKVDQLYDAQRRELDPIKRLKIVNALEVHALTTANVVPVLWLQRIMVLPKRLKGWTSMPSHFVQDISEVWLAP